MNKAIARKISGLLPFRVKLTCTETGTVYLKIFYFYKRYDELLDSHIVVRISDHDPIFLNNDLLFSSREPDHDQLSLRAFKQVIFAILNKHGDNIGKKTWKM